TRIGLQPLQAPVPLQSIETTIDVLHLAPQTGLTPPITFGVDRIDDLGKLLGELLGLGDTTGKGHRTTHGRLTRLKTLPLGQMPATLGQTVPTPHDLGRVPNLQLAILRPLGP